jgi:hypothetical protein
MPVFPSPEGIEDEEPDDGEHDEVPRSVDEILPKCHGVPEAMILALLTTWRDR